MIMKGKIKSWTRMLVKKGILKNIWLSDLLYSDYDYLLCIGSRMGDACSCFVSWFRNVLVYSIGVGKIISKKV